MNFNSVPLDYVEREAEKKIFKFLEDPEILAIRGPRQSGKTTLLKKIGRFLEQKHGPENVVFQTFEDELEKTKFEKNPRQYLEFYLRTAKRVFFLFDEIQYVKNAGKILKLLFDTHPEAKFIVSGSSTLDISGLGAFLVGRLLLFELFPFSFAEFLKSKDQRLFLEYQARQFSFTHPQKTVSVQQNLLNLKLREHLTYGGYPRVVLEKDFEKKKILLKNIFSTYVEKDLVKLYGSKYKEKAIVVLKYLAEASGSLINFNDLGQTASLYFHELKEILSILEETYVVGRLLPYHHNLITELKKNPKFYFWDLGLRHALLDQFDFSDQEWGRLLENYGFLLFKDKKPMFWRTTAKAEVDFVLKDPLLPVEIKSVPKVTRSLLSFLETYKPKFAVLANWERTEKIIKNEIPIFFVPFSLL